MRVCTGEHFDRFLLQLNKSTHIHCNNYYLGVFSCLKVNELLIPTNHVGLKGLTTRPPRRSEEGSDVDESFKPQGAMLSCCRGWRFPSSAKWFPGGPRRMRKSAWCPSLWQVKQRTKTKIISKLSAVRFCCDLPYFTKILTTTRINWFLP